MHSNLVYFDLPVLNNGLVHLKFSCFGKLRREIEVATHLRLRERVVDLDASPVSNKIFFQVDGSHSLRLGHSFNHNTLSCLISHVHTAYVKVDQCLGLRHKLGHYFSELYRLRIVANDVLAETQA